MCNCCFIFSEVNGLHVACRTVPNKDWNLSPSQMTVATPSNVAPPPQSQLSQFCAISPSRELIQLAPITDITLVCSFFNIPRGYTVVSRNTIV